MFNEKKIGFEKYISVVKKNTYICFIVVIITFFILLCISLKFEYYLLLILNALMIYILFKKGGIYYSVKRIKNYLIKNNLINKIGNIEMAIENLYFFTEYYMIVSSKISILCFKYSEIEKIYMEYLNKIDISMRDYNRVESYLCFVLQNGVEFKILIETANFLFNTNKNYCDIRNYLLNKKPNIIIGDEILKNKLTMR